MIKLVINSQEGKQVEYAISLIRIDEDGNIIVSADETGEPKPPEKVIEGFSDLQRFIGKHEMTFEVVDGYFKDPSTPATYSDIFGKLTEEQLLEWIQSRKTGLIE